MEQLLEMAQKVCDHAELYSLASSRNSVLFRNAKLYSIDSKMRSGLSLRIIKDGKLGFAYVGNLVNREELLQNALESLEGGAEAGFEFPLTKDLPQLHTYDAAIEHLTNPEMVEENNRVCHLLKSNTKSEVDMKTVSITGQMRIINTAGTDISMPFSQYSAHTEMIYPGSGSGIERQITGKAFVKTPDRLINELIHLYNASSSKVVEPKPGKMQVLFMPNSLYVLTWRIESGTSVKSVYENISPIAGKIDQKIFSETLTIYDDPLNDTYPGARAFDDEGVPCQYFPLVENGVLQNFYTDLNYAQKLNIQPTGHGYKTAMWGGETVACKPIPALQDLRIQTGQTSFSDLVQSIKKGIIVEDVLGAHSGNIPNGDYSVGINPGYYVENGEIVGRVKDAMVAGNIYDTLQQVVAVEDTLHPCRVGWMPGVLCENISIATKQ